MPVETGASGPFSPRSRLFYYNTGFFTQSRVRRILDLAGYDLTLGKPGAEDLIAVWGRSPTSARGEGVSTHTGAQLVHIEDAFIRSVKTGRDGARPLGLTIDHRRPYFDSSGPSDLEHMLATAPLDDAALLGRAKYAMEQMRHLHISKYNAYDLDAALPAPGYVLVIDQTRRDASIKYGGADANSFREMLVFAQEEHRGRPIVIKTHPETIAGHRDGHFTSDDLGPTMMLWDQPVSPHALLEGAVAVYTVSSGMGFEAIMAGHKPIVFGQPFYAGWGLSDDRQPIDRRRRSLTRTQLFAGAMMLYPKWYDPYRDRLCEVEDVLATISAEARAWREDRHGITAGAMRLWKRKPIQDFFGSAGGKVTFSNTATPQTPHLIWASSGAGTSETDIPAIRVEDGFLRSRGLGADLIAPLSLVKDDLGIYYNPAGPSRLEALIAQSTALPDYAIARADRLRRQIIRARVTKYNLALEKMAFEAHGQKVVLIPGQVEDDASISAGATDVATNEALITAARHDFPDAFLIYRPHPDVMAGLRPGSVMAPQVDLVSTGDLSDLLDNVDHVVTMTSLLGFEALLRDIPVTCYGAPFYAGWGLTQDRGPMPQTALARRQARPTLDQITHACLIDYPRYFDPVTRRPAPVERIVERLADGDLPSPSTANRLLAKAQGLFASYAHLWRR